MMIPHKTTKKTKNPVMRVFATDEEALEETQKNLQLRSTQKNS